MKSLHMHDRKRRLEEILFYSFLIIYGIILLYLARNINISEDEAYTLNTTSHDLAGVIKQSYHFEGQPPVYFLLLYVWRLFDHSIFFSRLFSILFTALSTLILYRLVNLLSSVTSSKWIIVLFLLNPFTVWAALEMRTYSLLIFLSLTAIYLFYRYFLEDRKKFLYWFLIVSVIGMYTQYFFLFLISTLALVVLLFRGREKFFQFCLYLVPVGILFLPNLFFLPQEIQLHESNGFSSMAITKIAAVAHSPQNLMLGINLITDVWVNRIIRTVFLVLILFSYLKLYREHKDSLQNSLIFKNYKVVLTGILILLVFFGVSIALTDVGYNDKYMAVVFPFFIILFLVFKIFPLPVRNGIFAALSLYYMILVGINYNHPVNTYDYKSVAKYIEKIETPDQPILFYRPAIALSFKYYYTGPNLVVPLPYPVKFDTSYLINIRDTLQLKHCIENIHSPSKKYVFVSDTTTYESVLNMNRTMVTDYLNTHYNITLDTLFYGWSKFPLRIRILEKYFSPERR